jgi:triphosphoribosyl-dephospho-CoA synthetase
MASEDIKIVIKKGEAGDGTAPTNNTGVASVQTFKKEEGKADIQTQAVNAAIIQTARQTLSTGIQQYGNLTGNYASVRTLNTVMSITSDILIIAKGGPVGAIYVAGKYASQILTQELTHIRDVQEHEFNIRRLGEISTKGSRYR